MSISKVFQNNNYCIYCADATSIFRPSPAKDNMLDYANDNGFTLSTYKNGNTAFQIIIDSNIDASVSEIYGNGLSCISTEGIDIYGNPFKKNVEIKKDRPWPFWCLISPTVADSTKVEIKFENSDMVSFSISLIQSECKNDPLEINESLSRLSWLNSREGQEDTLTKGFTPVSISGQTVKILGRDITISDMGFIESIGTYFTGINSTLADTPREILASPIEYAIFENGERLEFIPSEFEFTNTKSTACSWAAKSKCGELTLDISGRIEYEGSVSLKAKINNAKGRKLSVRLTYCPQKAFAKYFMGLGLIGCKTPAAYHWSWDANKRQDSFWCGGINGGVFVKPTAENITRPFVNIYFHHSKNYMPEPWVNGGKGYFELRENTLFFDTGIFVAADSISLSAELMISPFKLVNMTKHWNTRFYHKNFNMEYTENDINDALSAGCTHINLHHGNDTLPFLNYPMYDTKELCKLTDIAHKNKLGLKPYYTVRELTTRLPELFALRSLGDEIFPKQLYNQGGVPFHGGVDSFLTENFGDEVIPAWKHTFIGGKYDGTTDPTIITNPDSRISNFYIASIVWLIQNVGIDGLYMDDTGCNKTTLRRVRRIFDHLCPNAMIDFHTCNHFEDSPAIGFGFGHNMLIYMELLPYLDSLWVGEGYFYKDNTPEYLLTEVSGLPFGLMSEMLEDDCNVWRGMLYGMTSRYPYYQCYKGQSPVPVWQLRKSFENAEMFGFWDDSQPIFADNHNVFCTVYHDRKNDKFLCCFANFSDRETAFRLCGDAVSGRKIIAPYIENIQNECIFDKDDKITLSDKGGIILIIK